MSATIVSASADNLDLFSYPFAVGAAIFLFCRGRAGAGRVCAFLRSASHKTSSNAGMASGVPGFDAGGEGKDAAARFPSHPEMKHVSALS